MGCYERHKERGYDVKALFAADRLAGPKARVGLVAPYGLTWLIALSVM
jgi:hypothetical protein